MSHLSIASINDTDNIMKFMNDIWRENHILSKHKELFLHEFKVKDRLNFILAKDDNQNIVGLFGFIKYNNELSPDIAGSLWKVDPDYKEPMLGLKLRNYFVKNIKHNFFAAPGAGLQTKSIYKIVKMNWHRMNQFYLVNDKLNKHVISVNPISRKRFKPKYSNNIYIKKILSSEDLKEFNFEIDNVVPKKDIWYINKRFFTYPIFKYDVYALYINDEIKNIFICRESPAKGSIAYRIVEFLGKLNYLEFISTYLYDYMVEKNFEYIDFVSYGFSKELFLNAGFEDLNFDEENTIIPNFFEPFVAKNIPVYSVSYETDKNFRQVKSDGDQDRPNFFKN